MSEITTSAPGSDLPRTPYERKSYRYFVLAMLTLVYALNFVDR